MVPRPRNGLSLCSGGAGLDMGLMLAEPGFHTRCFVEWEGYPRQTIIAAQRAGYLAPAPIWDDITTFDARPLAGAIDTLLAGYPCQPFSAAGQRKGEDDERHLFAHVERIAKELGDGLNWIFLENVAGHVTLGGEAVLRALRQMGFTPAVGLFSAEEVGTPQERLRWFSVAHRDSRLGRREQPKESAGRGRTGPARDDSDLANAQNHGGRIHSGPGEPGSRASNAGRASLDTLAHTGRKGLQRREQPGSPDQRDGAPASGPATERGGFSLFPPPPLETPAHGRPSFEKMRALHRLLAEAGLFKHPKGISRPWTPPTRRAPRNCHRQTWRAAESFRRWKKKRQSYWARRLSPQFVASLMGWPAGHALCDCSETEWFLWQRHMRGALSQLPTASGAWIWEPPAWKAPEQMDLF